VAHGVERLDDRVAAERGLAGEQGVEDGPQPVSIAGGGDRPAVATRLLGDM